MAAVSSSKLLNRANGVLGFLIGVFGALAILGVFFKIAKLPNYELFMTIGFFGEAAAFVIMGLFALIKGFTDKPVAEAAEAGHALAAPQVDLDLGAFSEEFTEELRAELRRSATAFREEMRGMVHARFAPGFDAVAEAVAQDVSFLGSEMRQLGQEMQHARAGVHTLRSELDRVATGHLAEDAAALGEGMRGLSEGMTAAGASVGRMRSDLETMAHRFSAFNHAGDARGTNGSSQAAWVAGSGDRRQQSEVTR